MACSGCKFRKGSLNFTSSFASSMGSAISQGSFLGPSEAPFRGMWSLTEELAVSDRVRQCQRGVQRRRQGAAAQGPDAEGAADALLAYRARTRHLRQGALILTLQECSGM